MGRQVEGAGTAAVSTVGGCGRFRLGVLGCVVVVVSIVVAACSDSEPRRRPGAQGVVEPAHGALDSAIAPDASQPEAAAATSGAQPGPKVSDLGPGWAEVFVGKYVRQSRKVGLYWSIPRWGLDNRILGHPAMAGELMVLRASVSHYVDGQRANTSISPRGERAAPPEPVIVQYSAAARSRYGTGPPARLSGRGRRRGSGRSPPPPSRCGTRTGRDPARSRRARPWLCP